jgi:predicted nicotinamide N-methyase
MKNARYHEYVSIIEANTFIGRPALCPELSLRLLKENAPLTERSPIRRGKPHLFDWEGPRPYWAFAWASGQALARFILDNPEVVRRKHILDFGAGSGIGAIAAAKGGATTVTATDIDPIAIRAIELNAQLNGVVITAKQENIAGREEQNWNVLLAGDAFYSGRDSDANWLLNWVTQERLILIGDPPERGFPKKYLKELARYTVRTFPDLEDSSMQEACVYCLLPNSTTLLSHTSQATANSSWGVL